MKGECVFCGVEADGCDLEFCFIYDDLKFVYWLYMPRHLTESHTQAEYMKAQLGLTA